jgi:hypothetical protein
VRSSVKVFQLITSPVLLPIIRVALETIDQMMQPDAMELPLSTKEAREYEAS